MNKFLSPLAIASKNGDVKSVKYFLKHGVRHIPDADGRTPLFYASSSGHIDIVRILLESGATQEPDINGYRPIDVSGGVPELEELLFGC